MSQPARVVPVILLAALLPIVIGSCSEDSVKSSPPELLVTPEAVSGTASYGGSSPSGAWVQVRNGGDGELPFSAYAGKGTWCYLYYGSIVDTVGAAAPDSFAIAFTTGSLEAGEHFDTVWIEAPAAANSPVAIPVHVTIANVVQVNPPNLVFRAVTGDVNPPPQLVTILGASSTPLPFVLSSSQAWLQFSPAGGAAPTTVQVSVDLRGLPPGVYYDTIVVQASSARTPGRIPVRLEVASWLRTSLSSSFDFFGIWFGDTQAGLAVGLLPTSGDGVISRTADGGNTWDSLVSTANEFFDGLGDVWASSGRAWAVGKNAFIYYSPDGGDTWLRRFAPDEVTAALNGVHFADTLRGWAVGNDGVIIHTVDGGLTWEAQNSTTSRALASVWFADAARGWAVGNYGTILHTVDGGATWLPQANGLVQDDLWDLGFVSANEGWAVGDNGAVLHTVNGWQDWEVQGRPSPASLRAVMFVNPLTGWAVGTGGVILRTDDGGEVWRLQASGVTSTLQDVFFLNDQAGWICGSQGVLLRTSGGGD